MIANGECGSFNALVLECLEDISEELRREMQINSPDHKVSKEIQELSAKMQHKLFGCDNVKIGGSI